MAELGALSFACNVIQVIDFSAKVLLKTYEISQSTSGRTREQEGLLDEADSLAKLADSLQAELAPATPGKALSPEEIELENTAKCCNAVARRLIDAIHKASASTSGRKGLKHKISSFRRALVHTWKADELGIMSKEVEQYRQIVTNYLVKSIRYVRQFDHVSKSS